jgi:hypothetical protein
LALAVVTDTPTKQERFQGTKSPRRDGTEENLPNLNLPLFPERDSLR